MVVSKPQFPKSQDSDQIPDAGSQAVHRLRLLYRYVRLLDVFHDLLYKVLPAHEGLGFRGNRGTQHLFQR